MKKYIKKILIDIISCLFLFSPLIIVGALIYHEKQQQIIAEEIKIAKKIEDNIKLEKIKKESCKISLQGVNSKKSYKYNKDLEYVDIFRCDYENLLKKEKDIEEIENIKDEINRYIYRQYNMIIELEEFYPYVEFRKEKKELQQYLIK